jgi:hypothetical protein
MSFNEIHICVRLWENKKQSSPAPRHGGALGERRYSSHSLLTSALDGGEWSASRPGRALPRGKDPRYPLDRRLDGPQSRSGHRGYRKNPLPLPGIEPQSPGRPVRSQTLYWLSYPGPSCGKTEDRKNIPNLKPVISKSWRLWFSQFTRWPRNTRLLFKQPLGLLDTEPDNLYIQNKCECTYVCPENITHF